MTKQFNPKRVKEFMNMTVWESDGFYSATYIGKDIELYQHEYQKYTTVAELEADLAEWNADIDAQCID